MDSTASKKYLYADIIRVLAVFLVMLIHSAATLLDKWDKLPLDYWLWGNGYDSLARCSVPLFVMLSGALILGKEESLKAFFKKRFSKLLFPFVFWIGIYINWRIFYTGEVLPVDRMIVEIFTGPVYYHLWYLYMVVGLYLITPILRKLVKTLAPKDWQYLFLLWFLWNGVLPLISYLIYLYVGYSVNLGIKIPAIMGYAGYYVLGYFLSQKTFSRSSLKGWWGVLGVSTAAVFLGTWTFTEAAGEFQIILYDYFSVPVILQGAALFILLMQWGKDIESQVPRGMKAILSRLGKYSLGMYLVHVLLLTAMEDGGLGFELHGSAFHPAFAIPVTALVSFGVSYGVVELLARIPVLRYAVVERGGTRNPQKVEKSLR